MYAIPGGPGTIVASEMMRDSFSDEEFGALLAIQVGHVKSHHMSLELAIQYITNTNVLWKLLLFPLLIIKFLASGWSDVADYTADRCGALLLGGSSLINIAIVKRAAMLDQQADVSTEDLQAFLDGSSDISTDATQMERHFRIGNFITSQPNLHDRVETLNDFVHSNEGVAAFDKMSQIRTQLGIAQPETG
jgi:Zn-dependent protease with chaperone function